MAVLTPPVLARPMSAAKKKRTVNSIIYAYPGAGKTTLAATAPGPRLWLPWDPSGLQVVDWDDSENLLPLDPLTQEPIDHFDCTKRKSWPLFLSVLESLEAAGAALPEVCRTVILDTGTFAAKGCDKYLLSQEGSDRRVHPDVMSRGDYGLHAGMVSDMLARLCSLPANVVVNAHVTEKTWDGESGESRQMEMPNFGGRKVPAEAPGMFDLVGFLLVVPTDNVERSTVNGARVLQTEHGDGRIAKVRTRPEFRLPPRVENPNLSDIFQQVLAGSTPG